MTKKLLSRLVACAVLLLSGISASAQKYPNGLAADSVDPGADSLAISLLRTRLDSIRKVENRPVVALVLAGGGAKGASQVGVIQCIKDKGIPIDFVCGTSIGGLLGALLSVGYEPKDMLELFTTSDWNYILSDNVPQSYFSYDTKMYRSKYLVRVPFHYDESDFNTRILEDERYSLGKADFRLASEKDDMSTAAGVSNLTSSLPSGFAYGFNVGNLLSSLTVGYHDSLSFNKLPVPFVCVAADLVTCKAKNWTSGRLKSAMRSTMSIPGLFDPVRSDGMILVDGGVRNNFPTDIAKAVGADIIIGIDLANTAPTYSEVNNIATVAGQLITMLRQEVYYKTLGNVDVLVRPNTEGFGMLSFTPEAIDTLFARGYTAAAAVSDKLDSVKALIPSYHIQPARKAVNINKSKVFIDRIEFSGLEDFESRLLMGKIGLKAGTFVGAEEINDAMCKLQATGSFESVSYMLSGEEAPFHLIFSCIKAPTHRFGLGLRLDTETWASILINAGFNINKLKGLKFDIEAMLGVNQRLTAKAFLDLPGIPRLYASAGFSNVGNDITEPYVNIRNSIGYISHNESLYMSWLSTRRFDFQTGVRNRFYNLAKTNYSAEVLGCKKTDFVSAFASVDYYGVDDRYLPTRGISLSVKNEFDFYQSENTAFQPVNSFSADFRGVIPFGPKLHLIADLHLRNVYDRSSNYSYLESSPSYRSREQSYNKFFSIFQRNFVGGQLKGRYIEQQVPFVGYDGIVGYYGYDKRTTEQGEVYVDVISYDQLAVLNLDLRYEFAKNFYGSIQAGYVKAAPTLKQMVMDFTPEVWGAALQLTYKTVIGPVKARVFGANRFETFKENTGFSLSVGFDF